MSGNEWFNDKGVGRTAPATTGLLNISLHNLFFLCQVHLGSSYIFRSIDKRQGANHVWHGLQWINLTCWWIVVDWLIVHDGISWCEITNALSSYWCPGWIGGLIIGQITLDKHMANVSCNKSSIFAKWYTLFKLCFYFIYLFPCNSSLQLYDNLSLWNTLEY